MPANLEKSAVDTWVEKVFFQFQSQRKAIPKKGNTKESESEKVKVKVTQSSPTLCNPMDYTVHRILQARIVEWVAFPYSRESSQPKDRMQVSCIAGRFFTSWATRMFKSQYNCTQFIC